MAGELTALQYAELQEIIGRKIPNPGNCTVCGGLGTVMLSGHLVTPIVTSEFGGLQLSAQQYPQAMLLCSNCGKVTYYSYPILKGVVPHG